MHLSALLLLLLLLLLSAAAAQRIATGDGEKWLPLTTWSLSLSN
jgi:hypothetical protein